MRVNENNVLGVGIIGCGNISSTYLQFAPLFKGIEMRAVADISPQAAAEKAGEFNVLAQSVDELLENPDIDIIVNLTIPEVHYQVTRDIVLAGKHAYSEKPLALSMDDANSLKKLADAQKKIICCAPDTFLGGTHQQARHIIDAGEIGKITSGTCHLMSPGMEHWHPNPDFFFRPGGGPILDMGPYYIANLINLVGPVVRVTAFANTPRAERVIGSGERKGERVLVSTPTTIHAILEFRSGALITLSMSWDVKAHNHAPMELYGSKGSIFVPDPNFFGGTLKIADCEGKQEEVSPWAHPLGIANQPENNPEHANYRSAGLADMAAAIINGRPARCALEANVHATEVMLSVLKSAENCEPVNLETTCQRPAPLAPDDAHALLK